MTTFMRYRTARTPKPCNDYPRCARGGIKAGERYQHNVCSPNDSEFNQTPHWRTLNICCEHMYPEPVGGKS